MELLDETAIKQTYTGALMAIQTGCLGALHGEQSQQWVWYVGIQEEYYLECFKSYDIYM